MDLILALKSLKNSHFDWSLSCKVYNVWPKKVQRSYHLCHAKFEEKLTCGLENDTNNLANFRQNTWKCQNWDFDGMLFSNVQNAGDKKLRAIWRKIWRRIDLPFQNSHKEFDEFWLEHLKVSNVFPLMACFWPKYIVFELRKYIGVILLDTGEWCKIWKRIDLSSQNWHEEVNKFWPKHSKI